MQLPKYRVNKKIGHTFAAVASSILRQIQLLIYMYPSFRILGIKDRFPFDIQKSSAYPQMMGYSLSSYLHLYFMTQALQPMLNDENQKMNCGSALYEAISDCRAHQYCTGRWCRTI